MLRHRQTGGPSTPADADAQLIEAITDHVEAHVGTVSSVFHEIVSERVHIDVLTVAPTATRPFFTLVTAGMSARPMTAPPQAPDELLAELVLCLPPEWPLTEEAFTDERAYWPIRLLKTLARLPHQYDTWLWTGHTVPNCDPPEPYADGTLLCGATLLAPVLAPEEFERLESARGTTQFLSVIPLYAEELELKLAQGAGALAERLDGIGVTELLDSLRSSAA